MFQVETDSKHKFYLHENTVKAAKDIIIDRQVHIPSNHDHLMHCFVARQILMLKEKKSLWKVLGKT